MPRLKEIDDFPVWNPSPVVSYQGVSGAREGRYNALGQFMPVDVVSYQRASQANLLASQPSGQIGLKPRGKPVVTKPADTVQAVPRIPMGIQPARGQQYNTPGNNAGYVPQLGAPKTFSGVNRKAQNNENTGFVRNAIEAQNKQDEWVRYWNKMALVYSTAAAKYYLGLDELKDEDNGEPETLIRWSGGGGGGGGGYGRGADWYFNLLNWRI